MIKVLKASWGKNAAVITRPDELHSVVDRVREMREPTMLFLESSTGSTLVIGVGARDSVLTFAEKDGSTFHSVGDSRRTGYLQFRCRETLDEFHAEMAIPEAQAISAAFEFFETGARPQAVEWEPDW